MIDDNKNNNEPVPIDDINMVQYEDSHENQKFENDDNDDITMKDSLISKIIKNHKHMINHNNNTMLQNNIIQTIKSESLLLTELIQQTDIVNQQWIHNLDDKFLHDHKLFMKLMKIYKIPPQDIQTERKLIDLKLYYDKQQKQRNQLNDETKPFITQQADSLLKSLQSKQIKIEEMLQNGKLTSNSNKNNNDNNKGTKVLKQ